MSDPTPGEIMRRLDEVASRVELAGRKIDEFRNWAERLYVPRGEWVEGRRADQLRIGEVEKDVLSLQEKGKDDATFRRTALVMFAVAAFSGFISAAVAVALFFLGG